MANYYDPYGRRQRPVNRGNASQSVTMADYQQLVQAYQKLQGQAQQLQEQQQNTQRQLEAQAAELKNTKSELQIKDEAFKRQSADFKAMESELVWAKAAVQQLQEEVWPAMKPAKKKRLGVKNTLVCRPNWRIFASEGNSDPNNGLPRPSIKFCSTCCHWQTISTWPWTTRMRFTDGAAHDFLASIEATRQAFLDTLRRYGVDRIDPAGEAFDPDFHEAIGQMPDAKTPADHVAQVVQAGYREGERVIRPARVLVSSGNQGLQGADVGSTDTESAHGGGHGI